jgi:type II secretory pathway pseudopilin PulG
MIEIALCLAIIGFALVAIIGVLPLGMNAQRDNREATVINQDATVLIEAVRSAARGADYLTNNVYAITNYWAFYNTNGTVTPGTNGYTYNTAFVNNAVNAYYSLTNGANIIGVLSTPEFVGANNTAISSPFGVACTSNHILAYVRSFSGLASEKPPQDNSIMVGNTFTYRVYCVNAAAAFDTNNPPAAGSFGQQLAKNLHELRMTFLWPQLPNGNVGRWRQTFRTSVAGRLAQDSTNGVLFYYSPQSFTTAP